MKRFVLILADTGPYASGGELVGPAFDMEIVGRHFARPEGGAYRRGEMRILPNVTRSELVRWVNLLKYHDVVTIYFSGHGFNCNGIDYIQLKDCYLNVKGLLTNKQVRFVITDSCRNNPNPNPLYGFSGMGDRDFFQSENSLMSIAARHLWTHYARKLSFHTCLIQSCSPGQFSEDTNQGGKFTLGFFEGLYERALGDASFGTSHTIHELRNSSSFINQKPTMTRLSDWEGCHIPLLLSRAEIIDIANEIHRRRSLQINSYPWNMHSLY